LLEGYDLVPLDAGGACAGDSLGLRRQCRIAGELVLLPPLLGSSSRLHGRDDHDTLYFEPLRLGEASAVALLGDERIRPSAGLRRHGDQVRTLMPKIS